MTEVPEQNAQRRGPWTGLFKLIEEGGETAELLPEVVLGKAIGRMQQIAGKIAAFPDTDEHPDGEGGLKGRLECELADLMAAAEHVIEANGLDVDRIDQRKARKRALFRKWMTI